MSRSVGIIRGKRPVTHSKIEERLYLHIRGDYPDGTGRPQYIPMPIREFVFAKPRRWRFDFAWPESMVAAECEGGIWVNGAHTRGAHFTSDCEKYNAAALRGWLVLRFTEAMVTNGGAITAIVQALSTRKTISPSPETGVRRLIPGDQHVERQRDEMDAKGSGKAA